jgi:hypothetical protein
VRFRVVSGELELFGPDGRRFVSYAELAEEAKKERSRAEQAQARAEEERLRAEQERAEKEQARREAEQEREKVTRLMARLKEMGVDPEA